MEKRVNFAIEEHMLEFKNQICKRLVDTFDNTDKCEEIVQFVYNYDRLTLSADDLTKRKRVKNEVPYCERCMAKRSNGEQCTRRKKDGDMYCGTHIKGTPHGHVSGTTDEPIQTSNKVEVWLQDFKGIAYYIDNNMNIYQTEDIVSNKRNPNIIAKYAIENDQYVIQTVN
jgi:hypothetical protein